MFQRLLASFAIAAIVIAGCTAAGPTPEPVGGAASTAPGVTVGTLQAPSFGTVLTGSNGKALYTYAGDSATESTCTGACAAAWPPLETTSQPTAGTGLIGQLGTVTRSDGTTQVTYAGKPLYYWQGDTKPGDVTGNGIDGFSVATVAAAGQVPNASAPAQPAPPISGQYGY